MGVIKHKDVLSSKYVTAIISDSNDRVFFVPIKKTIGDYFITELAGNVYAFSLKGARILTYREILSKSVKVIEYDTSHFKSLSDKHKELELFLKKNRLPNMNRVQLAALTILGRRETKEVNGRFVKQKKADRMKEAEKIKEKMDDMSEEIVNKSEPVTSFHDIKALIKELEERQKEFPEETTNMINYLESLDIDHIVTPARKITEYLQEDLIATNPSFLGELLPRYQRLDNGHKGISNAPATSKLPWLKWIFVIMFGVMIAFTIAYGIEQGWFDGIIASFPSPETFQSVGNIANIQSPQTNQCSDEALQKRYPDPVDLKIAVDQGTETCDLPPKTKDLLKNVELPKVTPKQ